MTDWRSQQEPISLFDKPMPDDEKAAVQYFLSGYARRGWVICRKYGETGYWGGYGFAVLPVLYLLMPTQVEPLGLPAIRLIPVDWSEIGFLSHCLPSPFSVTEANGSQVELVPWRYQKRKKP
jgi:hypothetical protein